MKFALIFTTALCFLLVSENYALAQETTTEATTTVTSSNTTTTEIVPEPIPEETNQSTELSPRTQERITNLAANLSNRFDVIIFRLQNILTRLDSRVEKLESNGQNVMEAKNYLHTAKSSLDQAALNLTTIDTKVATLVGSTEPVNEWRNLKNTYINSRELIRSSHADMKTALILLKNPPPVETPTESTEPNN